MDQDTFFETSHPAEDYELTVAWPDDGQCAQRAGFCIIYSNKATAEADAAAWLKRGAESAAVTRAW